MLLRSRIPSTLMAGTLLASSAVMAPSVLASSHREAPFITELPKVDATDFYIFRSYEPNRADFVTIIANYVPLQDAGGGPNYFSMDPEALYEIHIDNDGDAVEDLTFQFDFDLALNGGAGRGIELAVGEAGATKNISIPLVIAGPVDGPNAATQNVRETYGISMVTGDRRSGTVATLAKRNGGATTFEKPIDNIGNKTIADYNAYASQFVFDVTVPGCTAPNGTSARVFVGQRKEGFAVNLGEIFDLVNAHIKTGLLDDDQRFDPVGPRDQGKNELYQKNVTSIALEIPIACLKGEGDVIGAWTTASLRQGRVLNPDASFESPSREGGPWTQVSRLGMPLVNEVVIGIADKNKFNASEPKDDGQFIDYVQYPTLPELLEILFPTVLTAPNLFPRADLVVAFLTGVPNVNATATPSEMVRLNTALPATERNDQNPLGAAGCLVPGGVGALQLEDPSCDPAGFPNGRRPGDDVVDIALRVVMGYVIPASLAPSGTVPLVDGATMDAVEFDLGFPYLKPPMAGSPTGNEDDGGLLP